MDAITRIDQTTSLVRAGSHSPVVQYLAGLSPGSHRGQVVALRAALAASAGATTASVTPEQVLLFDWAGVRIEHMTALRARLQEQHSPAYGRRIIAAVRGVLKACWRAGAVTHDTYARTIDVPPIRGSRLPAGRDLSKGEVTALMQVCCRDKSFYSGVRDAAMIALGVTCGPRIAEVASLELADYDQDTDRLVIRGKGNKERSVFLGDGPRDAMLDWLFIRGSKPGPLFVPILKGERIQRTSISTTSIHRMLAKRATQAGVEPFTWHDLRRTTVGDLLDAGADVITVQKIVGHADPKTTSRYDRRGDHAKKAAAGLLHVAYRKRKRYD